MLKYIKKILKRKKKPATPKPKKERDLLAPTGRTQRAIKGLKEAGLSDKEIERVTGVKP